MSLIAWWPCNEGTGTSVNDQKNAFDGTMDIASWTDDGTRGWIFESSTTNQIACGDVTSANTMSWAFWVNADTLNANNYILSKYILSAGNRSYRIEVNSSGNLSLQVSSDGSNNDVELSTDATKISTSAGWQHVIITFNAGTVEFYIDNTGLTDDGGNALTAIHNSTTALLIGEANGGGSGFDGQISDVYIFDHVLTSQERTDLFNDIYTGVARIWVNDAATKDGGEVLQTYPGAENVADGQIDMQNALDTTGLTPPLYLGVENADGAIAWRAFSIGGGLAGANRGIMRGVARGVG